MLFVLSPLTFFHRFISAIFDILWIVATNLLFADIDRLISIHGMVIRVSNLMPELREALFMCSICEHRVKREIIRGKISEPSLCPNCHSTYSYSVQHNLSRFSDVQIAKVQESQGNGLSLLTSKGSLNGKLAPPATPI